MITEIAQIDVKPGTEKDFEAAVAKARPLFLRAKGGKGFELHKSIEKPSRYRLMAKWETLENRRFPRLGGFCRLARIGRSVFCRAP
jgi:heme-degrading monooxygenase HmoA